MLLLDAAGTLIHPSSPVGEVYARHLEAFSGLSLDPDRMHSAFLTVFAATPPPDYSLHPFGHAAEHEWWHELVAAVLEYLGGEPADFARESSRAPGATSRALASPGGTGFDAFFTSLYNHFAQPSAWSLYSEVVPFLEAASRLGPLAVVSNFDDRLAPILDGLGIGPYFEHVFTSADARARKPDRALFDLALDRLNAAPTETFHCGDSRRADYEGALAAGLRAFHLQRPQNTLFDFLEFCSRPSSP